MFVGPFVSHSDWFVLYGVDHTPPRRGRAGSAPDLTAEQCHNDRSAIILYSCTGVSPPCRGRDMDHGGAVAPAGGARRFPAY